MTGDRGVASQLETLYAWLHRPDPAAQDAARKALVGYRRRWPNMLGGLDLFYEKEGRLPYTFMPGPDAMVEQGKEQALIDDSVAFQNAVNKAAGWTKTDETTKEQTMTDAANPVPAPKKTSRSTGYPGDDYADKVFTLEELRPKHSQLVWVAMMPAISVADGLCRATLAFARAVYLPDEGIRLMEDPPNSWGLRQIHDTRLYYHPTDGLMEVSVARPWTDHYLKPREGLVWAPYTGDTWSNDMSASPKNGDSIDR